MILIITNKEDTHPTPVIQFFNKNHIPVFRLNTDALLVDYEFNWWCNETGTDFHLKNTKIGLELNGNEISSIWDRRPMPPTLLKIENSELEINKHNLEEAHGFLSFLRYYLSDIFSIGSIINDRVAASKMLQLKIAQNLGMKVPTTCFSNSKKEILNFSSKFEDLSLKSIYNDNVWLRDEIEYVFYAKKVTSSSIESLPEESFNQTINFIQNYIEKLFELRVTVVCNKIFACKIDSQILEDENGKNDWRQGYDYGLKHENFQLPETIERFCLSYLRKMNLNFGCFDFIVTPELDYVFLECNPNGQWLWIEEETGMKISTAIAESLLAGKKIQQ